MARKAEKRAAARFHKPAAPVDKLLRPRLAGTGTVYVSLHDVFCRDVHNPAGAGCAVYADDGTPLYFDRDHFTAGGAAFIAQRLNGEMGLAAFKAPAGQGL